MGFQVPTQEQGSCPQPRLDPWLCWAGRQEVSIQEPPPPSTPKSAARGYTRPRRLTHLHLTTFLRISALPWVPLRLHPHCCPTSLAQRMPFWGPPNLQDHLTIYA